MNGKIFDISFLRGNLSARKLSEILLISNSTARNYLNDRYCINKEQLSLLLKYYSCKTLIELSNKDLREEKYDITFLKGKISANELSEILFTSVIMVYNYIYGRTLIDKEKLDLLLKHYSCTTLEELKKKDFFKKEYDITFLKGKIFAKNLGKILFVSPSTASNYLNGIYKINDNQLLDLLKHYSCKTLDELKALNVNDKNDISFLNGKMPSLVLSEILQIDRRKAQICLRGEKFVNWEQLLIVLKYYSCTTLDELKEKIQFEKFRKEQLKKEKSLKKEYDITFLKGKISTRKLGEILFVSGVTASNYLNGTYKINKSQLLNLLNNYSCETLDELRELNVSEKNDISFLKGKISSKILSEILNIDKEDSRKCLRGQKNINWEQLLIVLKYYSCNNIDELKEKILFEEIQKLQELEENISKKEEDYNKLLVYVETK